MIKKDGKNSLQYLFKALEKIGSYSSAKICQNNNYLKQMNKTFYHKNISSYEI